MVNTFTEKVINLIKQIPAGKVVTYGQIAEYAGNSRGARQISWILSSSSKKYDLPWHRVINSHGKISLKHPKDYEYQKDLLKKEGISFLINDRIDLKNYMWKIKSINEIK